MRHTREKVIKRTIREFERLDHLVNNLTYHDWNRDVLAALQAAPKEWFSGRDRRPEWPVRPLVGFID